MDSESSVQGVVVVCCGDAVVVFELLLLLLLLLLLTRLLVQREKEKVGSSECEALVAMVVVALTRVSFTTSPNATSVYRRDACKTVACSPSSIANNE